VTYFSWGLLEVAQHRKLLLGGVGLAASLPELLSRPLELVEFQVGAFIRENLFRNEMLRLTLPAPELAYR
jgi:hypothetical protein